MNPATATTSSAASMEALFDSVVQGSAPDSELRSETPADNADAGNTRAAIAVTNTAPDDLLAQVGRLTRALHDNLRALGYDKVLEKTSAAIPDAKERLVYVITMTEQAAERALNATDVAMPIQDALAQGATALTTQWDSLIDGQLSIAQFVELVSATRDYLGTVPTQTAMTNAQLMEIMMAQDFQDLTGQVIKKTTEIIQAVEQQLVQLLLDHTPAERWPEDPGTLTNGPAINPTGRTDIVTSQGQVDDLLESLGF